eukprot:CAMPEP_0198137048 /NCGR_PEP_ID=MMETSP1443-20131203/606_1 /TAXON_ID=186043 /ORGANISM="Entomoneis sp., Strain CCMP2396" /LENGTH=199 /DNA_ID=CAMNT_0043798373 /DNA_START=194 /DNA_END=793 /DNA_ORIENTATION=-
MKEQALSLEEGDPARVSFSSMAKIIAARWHSIDHTTKEHCDNLALKEKLQHKKAMAEWRRLQKPKKERKVPKSKKTASKPYVDEPSQDYFLCSTGPQSAKNDPASQSFVTTRNRDDELFDEMVNFCAPEAMDNPESSNKPAMPEHMSSFSPQQNCQESLKQPSLLPPRVVHGLNHGIDVLANKFGADSIDLFVNLFQQS